jgi:diguanylate cyclase (GGDEF)-like protein
MSRFRKPGTEMHFSNSTGRFNNLGGWLVILSVGLALGLWVFGAGLLWTMRQNELAKAVQASDNTVSAMSADIARNLEMFDLSLRAVIDNLDHPGVQSASRDIRQLVLFDRAATAKHLSSIKVLNEAGQLTIDSRTLAPPRKDLSSHDYFLVHRDNPNVGLYIGQPFIGGSGKWLIGISRRLSRADGSFAGVVVGTIELDYFRELFEKVVQTPSSVLALFHTDGTLLMRSPFNRGDIGRDMSRSDFFVHTRGTNDGHYEAPSAIDGVNRIYAYQRVGDYPLLIGAGISTKDALAGWWHDALAIGAILLALGLSTVALAAFAHVELKRRELAEGRLKTSVITDPLTEIRNRRGFENAISAEWNGAFASGVALSLLMIDVDHFKDFNDKFGHQAGDRALIRIGRVLERARRGDQDVVARYGGEEFAMILPAASTNEAYRTAEWIRLAVENAVSRDKGGCWPTVSIGVCSRVPTLPDSYDIIIASADSALYEAKRQGRNRTVAHDYLLAKASSGLAA